LKSEWDIIMTKNNIFLLLIVIFIICSCSNEFWENANKDPYSIYINNHTRETIQIWVSSDRLTWLYDFVTTISPGSDKTILAAQWKTILIYGEETEKEYGTYKSAKDLKLDVY